MAINTLFKNIAIAIREKAQTTGSITPSEMPDAIRAIPSGQRIVTAPVPMTENSTTWTYGDPISYVEGTTIASASMSWDSTRQPWKAFSQTYLAGEYDCWHSSNSAPQWIAIEFPKKARLRKFTIANRTTNGDSIREFDLQGSDDGQNWTDISTGLIFDTSPNRGVVKSFEVTNDTYYSRYRWYIKSLNSYCVIAYIRFDDIEFEGG